jgi:hypothetical protein
MESQLLAGHPDIQGLCRALVDWSAELRLLQASQGLATAAPRLAHVRSGGDRLACRANAAVASPRTRELAQKAEKPAAAGAGRARKEGFDATD